MMKDRIFNLFYINYEKTYEIAALIDNRVPYRSAEEKGRDSTGYTELYKTINDTDELHTRVEAGRDLLIVDEFRFRNSKSTILETINETARVINKANTLEDTKPECIVLINNCRLQVVNKPEVMSIKSLANFTMKIMQTSSNGDDGQLPFERILQEYSYIFEAKSADSYLTITFKIPMISENEFLSGYTVSDLEFGLFTLVGIYKGCFNKNVLFEKLDGLKKVNADSKRDTGDTYYIDLIAVMQYLEC